MSESKPTQKCKQCGTCCRKSSPSFHKEDKPLIEKGVIPSKHLFTIRKGEPAYENVKGKLMPVTTDIIKIKGKSTSWTCFFLDEKDNSCSIYQNRPVECRALKCWDTREIEQIYAKNRLSRKDLLSQVNGLWSLVTEHQDKCSYEKLKSLADTAHKDINGGAGKSILEMIRYDMHLRKIVVEKGGLDSGMIEFLFGRPLTKTIHGFGLGVASNLTSLYLLETSQQSF